MKYREIWHELHLRSTPHAVYEVLTDPKKLAGWWTTDTRGQSAVGRTLEFWFNGHLAAEMVVTELKADALVRWRVTDRGIGDWTDTEISFEIFRGSDRAKEQRFDPADLFVKFMERLTVPPKIARSERRRSSGSLPRRTLRRLGLSRKKRRSSPPNAKAKRTSPCAMPTSHAGSVGRDGA